MAREILFRGRRKDNGEWVTGTPFIFEDRCKMIQAVAVHPDFVDEGNVYYSEGFPVDPETVGQYTGLTDKNGKRIFEGDIIQKKYNDGVRNLFWLSWSDYYSSFMLMNNCGYENFPAMGFNLETEVIGNIHDNPELLNGTES